MINVRSQNESVVGRNNASIGIGDGSVVTMSKRGRKPMKKKEITFCYVPSGKEYTPQQLEQFKVKETQLINYIIDKFLHKEAPST